MSKIGEELSAQDVTGMSMAIVPCVGLQVGGAPDGTDIIAVGFGGATMRCPYNRTLSGTVAVGDNLLMLYNFPQRFLVCKVGGTNYKPGTDTPRQYFFFGFYY